MPRKPVNQHRALTAVSQGHVVLTYIDSSRWCGSWQWWDTTAEKWRATTSGETHALDTLAKGERPMINVSRRLLSGAKMTYSLTDYGILTLKLWDQEMGPVTDTSKNAK